MNDKVLCENCREEVEYRVWTGYVHAVVGDRHIGYFERTALCEKCGREVYVPWIWDDNQKRREEAYARTEV